MKKNEDKSWIKVVKKYSKSDIRMSLFQIFNSFLPYFLLWGLMIYSLRYSYWITLALSILAAGFLVRIFIIFHDCGHGSFFRSERLNRITGIFGGLLSFTPYHSWHYPHAIHHQTIGNLDKRGIGDVMTLTLEEYLKLSQKKKIGYRIYRNPFVLFLIAPPLIFLLFNRFPDKNNPVKIKIYTHLTTLLLILIVTILIIIIGFKEFLLIQLPIIYFSSVAGVWLFYVQHQFKDVIWVREKNWDYKRIALEGSSYLKLPKILQWFSGNIGFHHIHHLGPKIPNYKLERFLKENPEFQIKPLTIFDAFKSLKYHLWDEKNKKLIGFGDIKN